MIPLMRVYMSPPEELMPELQKILYSGMVTEGVKVKEFEEKFQNYIGCSVRPLSVNSGTSALQLAYRCIGVKNKIVLATPMTCTASNMPILTEGGKIVWCDIDPKTGNISAESVERNLKIYGSSVAAVVFVDFAGYPAELKKLIALKDKYNFKLVEDAAQSLGAEFLFPDEERSIRVWHKIGSVDSIDYTCFSFQAIKQLTTVDGGMLICNDKEKWGLAKKLKWYGINREAVKDAVRWHYDIEEYGYKMHMNNVNATIGIVQLDHIENVVGKHICNGRYFDNALKGVGGLELLSISEDSCPSYWIYMIKVDRRDDFAKMMTDAGIAVNVAHIRNDGYTCFKDTNHVINVGEELPGLKEFNDKYISIPCGWWLNDDNREYIVKTIKKGW
jgi:perosamine synthetase